ncbi:helix-turn-helix domain-containing protein [Azospirillum argentinense]
MSTPKRGRGAAGRPLHSEAPNPVDIHVGARVRLRRTLLGMSQEKLGDALRLTFQQVQKYERGANRISASRLFDLSRVLDVPVSFFDDMSEATTAAAATDDVCTASADSSEPDPMAKRETLELVRAYYRINDPSVRKRLFEMTKVLGRSSSPGSRTFWRGNLTGFAI